MSEILQDSVEIKKRRVSNYLNTEVKDFALYTIRTRAMPSIMDGLRVGARKIMWATLTGDLSKKQKVKMPSLTGDVMKLHYNHGPASLENTIVQLGSKHIFKYAPLEIIGQIGVLRAPDSDTAQRYLHVRTTKYLDLFKFDFDLLTIVEEEGDKIEPKYFLPIIPVVLLWRTNSPGFGFSFKSFSYKLDDIIDNCIKSLHRGSCHIDDEIIPIKPEVYGVKEENIFFNAARNSWYNVGEYNMDFETDNLIVTDLPYNVTFENYDNHLQDLIEKGYIKSFIDLSQDGNIRYIIKFEKNRLKTLSTDKWKFFTNMKLFSKISKDTLNCIDEDGKSILFFNTTYELIDTFVRKRLNFYNERKTITIDNMNKKVKELDEKIMFIKLVTEEKLIINKRPIVDIKKDLDKYKLSYTVLNLKIDKLTKEEIEKMEKEIIENKKYLEYLKNTTPKEMYINDLIELKDKFSKITKYE
ncbi:hypothetical protein M0Q97_07180 [Candidatus Dojkabacteria bacterium]|jgi:DNA topoisomerase-2|nr:hypothetical protein [Candidatus Dojkabacteria bacterium]